MENENYSHYFKFVGNLEYIDVYRVLSLFPTGSPALDHAAKKLLVAGERGSKSRNQDIAESVASHIRYLEMELEGLGNDDTKEDVTMNLMKLRDKLATIIQTKGRVPQGMPMPPGPAQAPVWGAGYGDGAHDYEPGVSAEE